MQLLTNCPTCDATTIGSFIKVSAQMHSNKERFNFDQCAKCKLVFLNPRVPLDLLKKLLYCLLPAIQRGKSLGEVSKIGGEQSKKS